jgi:hypothetical protein
MRTKIIILILALGAAIGGIGFTLKEWARRQEAEQAIAATASRRAEAERVLRETEQRARLASEEQERLVATAAAARRKAAPAADAPRPNAAPAFGAALREAMLHDPQLQNLQLDVVQSKLAANYLPLAEQLKLSNEQMTRLLVNLRRRGEQDMDLAAIIETQHLAPDDPAVAKLRQQAAADFAAAQTELLGEAGWRKFRDYERAVPMRELVNELAGAMAISGAGINAAQGDALTDLLAGASPNYRGGGTASRASVDWDQVLAQARTTLTEPQFAVFRNGVIQSRNMDRMRELALRK